MAKTTKKTKSASKATRCKPAPVAVEATAEPNWDALERERAESAARTAAIIAARDTQVEAMIAGSGRNAVRAELAPLHDALNMVCVWSGALVRSIAELPKLPKSVARGRWLEQWADEYRRWWDAIEEARALARTPAVAAIMDAGEQRPAKKWTSQTVAELDRLAATLHPSREGGSGRAFIRAGAESLPANFSALADAIAARVVELQSVPQSESAAPERVVEPESDPANDAITFTDNDRKMYGAMATQDGSFLWSSHALGEAAGVSNETARRFVVRMRDHGLAERPEGDRKGARLTTKGRRRWNGKSAKPQGNGKSAKPQG
jgi:hypothetical protein